jgi:hypothetical protein
MSGNGPNLAAQATQGNPAALDECLDEKMKPHVHLNEWRVEQGQVLLVHHNDRYMNEQCWTVTDFYVNSISGLVGQLEFDYVVLELQEIFRNSTTYPAGHSLFNFINSSLHLS